MDVPIYSAAQKEPEPTKSIKARFLLIIAIKMAIIVGESMCAKGGVSYAKAILNS